MSSDLAEKIRKEVAEVPYWYHSIDLGHGVVTPGWIEDQQVWLQRLNLPPTLEGLSVLDVGAWDGFYSFECERRGATRVLATDKWVWDRAYDMNGFLTARRILNSQVDYLKIDPHDISKETVGEFDLVLFLGVYYHLRDPLAVLDRLSEVTKRQIIVESMVVHTPGEESVPLMRFSEGLELGMDPSNWWAPNLECLVQTVRSSGFARVDVVSYPDYYTSRYFRRPFKEYLKRLIAPLVPPRLRYLELGRAVVHGFKHHTYTNDRNYEGEFTKEQLKKLGKNKAFPHEQ